MLLIEAGLLVLALILAFIMPRAGESIFLIIEKPLARLARRRLLAVIVVGTSALALRSAVLPILPIPYPALQDEFSYQLMADTFAHGRLTNPTHPMWIHFESFGIIHRPTYCSMYYPAQGFFMALGQVILNHTFWGVWFSIGIMCAAICWMLQGWVSTFWAFIGGLLAAIRIGTFSYWANSYWGGAVTAIGGALVLGAAPRLKSNPKIHDSLLMGLGFALLATSRPFEGLFFSIPVIVFLITWIARLPKAKFQRTLFRVVFPLALSLVVSASWMMFYFWRTTGDPFLPAYIVDMRTYFVDPAFPWLPLHPIPHYNHEILRRNYLGFGLQQYELAHAHLVLYLITKPLMLWFFFLGPLLTLPFVALGLALPPNTSLKKLAPKTAFLLIVCATTVFAASLPVYTNPHYAAPCTAAIYGLIVIAMQRVRRWNSRGNRSGIFLVRAILVIAIVLLGVRIGIPIFHLPIADHATPQTWSSNWFQLLPRAEIETQLQHKPGKHVVIVHYSSIHNPREGWVSNSADIDGSKIVWAHDMGRKENEELIRYFAGRNIWEVFPDESPIRLLPYSSAAVD